MKIAIQGHPTRGKEVIQILESLGGINERSLNGNSKISYYYIDYAFKNRIYCHDVSYVNRCCKKYTLEEFEKEFPFKIGDEVIFPAKVGWLFGKVTDLTYMEGQFKYEVDTRINYHYVESHKLSLHPMKEERNITLTLEKAKEWYKKGGELKEIALQAFTEKELNPLPRSWKEFCERCRIEKDESYINSDGKILSFVTTSKRSWDHICPSKKSAEAHLAMIQLEQLRDCWRQGWVQTSTDVGYRINKSLTGDYVIMSVGFGKYFLAFPTKEMAEEFLKCFRDLIEQAGDLI